MDRRSFLLTSAAGLLVPVGETVVAPASAVLGAPRTAADDDARAARARPHVQRVLTRDLHTPWGVAFLPHGNALVGERDTGRVYRVFHTGGRHLVGHVPGVHSRLGEGGETGLLGLALHPDFRRNRWVYAYHSTRSDNRIVRMRFSHGRLHRPHVVLSGIPTSLHHNGGRLAFGPGGLLYASTGDAEQGGLAQQKGSLAGKILRLTPRGHVPPHNPFGNYTWSYGHRNVEGIAFDAHGRLWASEFGNHRVDELNRIRRGRDYGWPYVEGGDGHGHGYRDPLTTWRTEHASPSGVAIAHGRAFLGALQGEALLAVRLQGRHRGHRHRYLAGDFGRIRTVAKAPDGSLWITTSNHDGRGSPARNDDRVIRVVLG